MLAVMSLHAKFGKVLLFRFSLKPSVKALEVIVKKQNAKAHPQGFPQKTLSGVFFRREKYFLFSG